ncbi:MAG: hypothetical protein N2444_10625, partial [Methylocystis sp.]|nr:hypothetical protein [Methylocystis sp.]
AVLTIALACATPFAAFAAFAALMFPRREALIAAASVWLANQAVGFVVLGYPITPVSMLWGGAIGASVVGATLATQAVCARAPISGVSASLFAFGASQIVFRAAMMLTALVLGGIEGFTLANLAYLSALDAVTLIVALALVEFVAFVRNKASHPMARPGV